MRKFTLFFVALLVTLGVSAQTASDYYTFEAEVLLDASKRLTSQDSLTAGKHIVIQHCHEGTDHEGHEGSYLTIYSLVENGTHTVYMQENAVGVSVFTTEDGSATGRFKLQTSHMRCDENAPDCRVCWTQSGNIQTSSSGSDFLFKYAGDGKWQIALPGYSSLYGDAYLWVDTKTGKNPEINLANSSQLTGDTKAQSYFYLYEVDLEEDTYGTIQYVEDATVRLTGPSGNQVTTTHTGWSDFYEFVMYSKERFNATNYGVSISNVLYHSGANLITANISYPFAISGGVAKIPVHLCPAGEGNRIAIVDGALKMLSKGTASDDEWTKNESNQWYIYPKYDAENKNFYYALQNVATKQYIQWSTSETALSLYKAAENATVATLPEGCFFYLNGNEYGKEIKFCVKKSSYVYLIYGTESDVTTTATYTTYGGVKFSVPNVATAELNGVPSIGFTRYFHEDTYFWDGGVVATENYPDGVKSSLKNAQHEDRTIGTHNVYTVTTGITVTQPGQVNVTFHYTSGGNALQVLGVDIVTAGGQVISSDYHAGKAGNPSQNNQYILTNVAAEDFYLRYWVCSCIKSDWEGHDLAKVRGRIEVQGANYRWIPATSFNAETATWYRMRLSDGLERYISAQAGYVDDNNNLLLSNNTPPADKAGLWTMVGNETDGYKFYNYTAGADYALKTVGEGANARTYLAPVAEASLYDVVQEDGNYQFFVKLHGTDNYLYKQGDYLATAANALGDANAVLTIETVNSTTWTNEEIEIGGGDDENSEEYIWRYSTSVSLGNRITDVASLTEGQKVVFKNVGQNNYITIDRSTLKANAQATANGLSVFTVHKNGDKFTFESARPGYYFPTIVNSGWPGYYMTTTSHEFEVSTTHADGSAAGEGRFVIKDATTNAYFDGGGSEFTGWQGTGNNSKFEIYPVTSMGDEYHSLVLRTVEITDNLGYLHTGGIGVWNNNNEYGALGKGYYAGELNLNFADNKVTGTVNFGTFPVSRIDEAPNMVLVSSYPDNYALFYWRANGDNVETEKDAKPKVSNLGVYAWAIYPKLESDGFKFYLQNVATGKYLTSTKTTNSHATGDITLSETGTGFTVEENYKFKFVTEMYISTNSSAPGNPVQSLGVYNSGHYGTQNRIHSFVDVVKESLIKTGVGYPATTSEVYQNVNTLDGTEGFEAVKSNFEAYYNCADNNIAKPEDGKAYKISAWWRGRTLPLTFVAETSVSGLYAPAYVPTENAVAENVSVFVCRKMEDGTYAFVTDNGYYLGWQTDNSNSNATSKTYSDGTHWKVEKAVTGSNTGDLKQTDLLGKLILRAHVTVSGAGTGWFAYMYSYGSKHFHNDGANALYYGDNAHTVYYTFEEVPYTLNKVGLTTISASDKLLSGEGLVGKTISTFSAPYATVIPEGVTAYYAAQAEEAGQLILKPVDGDALPAEQGVVLIGNASSATMLPVAGETVATIDSNEFEHSATGPVTMGANAYILANGGQGIGIYKATAGSTLKQGKAYLNFTGSSANSFVLNFSGVTTDIEGAPTVAPSQQVIYDLSGRRVNAVTKGGIYIVNGKKMIIK